MGVSRKSDERAFPRMPLGKSHRVASPKGCDTASHAPDDGRTDHTKSRNDVGGEGLKQGVGSRPSLVQPVANPAPAPPSFAFTLHGQIPSGKNAIKTTRTGQRYPTARFQLWRDTAVVAMVEHVRKTTGWTHWPLFKKPARLEIEIHYAAGDLRRRDMPGMMDAIYHVLEKAQIVEDDAQIGECHWYELPVDRQCPHVAITLREVR